MSSYYSFDDASRSIVLKRHDTPTPWINYLSNGSLHAFVSQAGGGMLWWRSPLVFRLTRYRSYNLPIDSPGFYIYIRQEDGIVWSPSFRPADTPLDAWTAHHQPGFTTFNARKGDLEASLSLWIMPDQDTMVWQFALTNHGGQPVELDVFAYVELSMLDWRAEVNWGCYVKHNINTWRHADSDALVYLYHHLDHCRAKEIPLVYLASSRPVQSYAGDRDAFVGRYRDERNPLGVERNHCGDSQIACGEPCAALQVAVTVPAGKSSATDFFLGTIANGLSEYDDALAELTQRLKTYRSGDFVRRQRDKLASWWNEHLDVLQCQVPDRDTARQINTWNPTQNVHTGRYSRSISFYAAGIRGVGYRDTCQDMLSIAYRKPQWAREVFEFLLEHQFADGGTIHYCWPEEKAPPLAELKCDNHLWLPMLAHAIVAETGDLSWLDKPVTFLKPDGSGPADAGSVWDHLMAAMAFTENHRGVHGLPLMLHGDWNDAISRLAPKLRGESVFAAQQYVYDLELLIDLAEASGRGIDADKLRDQLARQRQAIEAACWDGQWWVRAFDDNGGPIGSHKNEYGKIWINAQSWAVLANCGSVAQQRSAMDQVQQWLDTDIGLVKMLPSYPTAPESKTPYCGYSKGCGENGAIFCHANTWAVMAEAKLGNAERAWKYYTQLIPHVACQKVGVDRYQGEPYAYASNIVGPENSRFGWANVTQVTGTATWMDIAATQYLLGVRAELGGLRIDPCIPASWKHFEVTRRYRGCRVTIRVENPAGVQKGVKAISVDGRDVAMSHGPILPHTLIAGRNEVAVDVTMG